MERVTLRGPEDLSQSCRIADLETVALGRSRGIGHITTLSIEGVRLDQELAPFDFTVRSEARGVTLVGGLAQGSVGAVNGCGFEPDSFRLIGSGSEIVGSAPAWTPLMAIAIDVGLIEEAQASLGEARSVLLLEGGAVRVDDSAGEIRATALDMLEAGLDPRSDPQDPVAARELAEAVARAIDADGTTRARVPLRRSVSFALVCDALEFAATRGYRSATIGDICRAVGASETRLREAFRSIVGTSPKSFLTASALNQARAELMDPSDDTTVTEVATALGFWHYGRFAHTYRELFGELPSETLSTARGPCPPIGSAALRGRR